MLKRNLKKQVESHKTAPWANRERQKKDSGINVPDISQTLNAKEYVDENEKWKPKLTEHSISDVWNDYLSLIDSLSLSLPPAHKTCFTGLMCRFPHHRQRFFDSFVLAIKCAKVTESSLYGAAYYQTIYIFLNHQKSLGANCVRPFFIKKRGKIQMGWHKCDAQYIWRNNAHRKMGECLKMIFWGTPPFCWPYNQPKHLVKNGFVMDLS